MPSTSYHFIPPDPCPPPLHLHVPQFHGGTQTGRPIPRITGAMRLVYVFTPWRGKEDSPPGRNMILSTWKSGHTNARIAKPRASGQVLKKAAYHPPVNPEHGISHEPHAVPGPQDTLLIPGIQVPERRTGRLSTIMTRVQAKGASALAANGPTSSRTTAMQQSCTRK